MIKYTLKDFNQDIDFAAECIRGENYKYIYGVPRGGLLFAQALAFKTGLHFITKLTHHPDKEVLVVDDIIDSGRTRERYKYYDFLSIHKSERERAINIEPFKFMHSVNEWVEYWWEENEMPAEDSVTRMIQAIGDDPNRTGLLETPKRVVKSWDELFYGYKQNPKDVFKTFDEDHKFGGLVYLNNIEFYSTCEHHLLPFFGKALIAYIPNGPVIGVSKLARLLDVFSRRLQIQERIAEQVTDALMEHLNPIGTACLIEAKHFCMACRGVKKQHSEMGYHSLKGVFLEDSYKGIAARQELMTIWNK